MTAFQRLRDEWPRLFLELVVVTAGVSLSFALQDWRQAQRERSEEQRLLEGLRADLNIDAANLERRSEVLDLWIEHLVALQSPAARKELDNTAIDQAMDALLSYSSFAASKATYQELRQTGSSSLIRDKALLRRVIETYESAYPAAKEWDDLNRSFVLDQLFPFIDREGPSFESRADVAFTADYHRVFEALEDDTRFRNQMRTALLFKRGQKQIYTLMLERVQQTLAAF